MFSTDLNKSHDSMMRKDLTSLFAKLGPLEGLFPLFCYKMRRMMLVSDMSPALVVSLSRRSLLQKNSARCAWSCVNLKVTIYKKLSTLVR